jgi:alkylation response protein AidB-like acyl-CoA dehydrogenase
VIEWSEEQRRLREALRRWHAALSADHLQYDRDGSFPWGKWKLIRESDLLRIPFDAAWGGLGENLLTTMYVLEDLGYGCRDTGLTFSIVTHMVSTGVPVQRFGSAELKARYMAPICEGSMIGAHAITEPEGGSDVLSMRTTATPDGDHFVLQGTKTFVSNGPVADVFVVYARTDPKAGPFGVTAFLLERDTPGLAVGPPTDKMGLRSSPFCELVFDGCRVPRERMIGKLGSGFLVLDHVMKWEILCSFVVTVGGMQHRLERCVAHARTRIQFGKPIGSFQSVSNKLVDMKIGVETSRKWLYDTAERFSRNMNITVDLAISKLVASESNVASAMAAVQIFGGRGYLTEYGLEKDLRDAISGTIYSGTSEIQRGRIAKMQGL